MDDTICLGYQAAVVSLRSPSYDRLWLSGKHLPGDTVSCTQAENLLLAAEARTGVRPLRRTDLLCQRIAAFEQQVEETKKRRESQGQAAQQAKEALVDAQQQQQDRQAELEQQEQVYQERQRKERPTAVWRKPGIVRKPPPNAFNIVKMPGKLPKSGSIRPPRCINGRCGAVSAIETV